jgi:hypothetical protein
MSETIDPNEQEEAPDDAEESPEPLEEPAEDETPEGDTPPEPEEEE